jgi:hypothetical protein
VHSSCGADYSTSNLSFEVAKYSLLFYRGAILEYSEELQAGGHLEAVHQAVQRPSTDVVELWCEEGKIASFRPLRIPQK